MMGFSTNKELDFDFRKIKLKLDASGDNFVGGAEELRRQQFMARLVGKLQAHFGSRFTLEMCVLADKAVGKYFGERGVCVETKIINDVYRSILIVLEEGGIVQ